jgi:hypothetical protein
MIRREAFWVGAGMPVVFDQRMPEGAVIRIGDQVHAHSEAALQRALAEANEWVLLDLRPYAFMNRTTGQLFDLPDDWLDAVAPVCRRCGERHRP